MSASACKTQKYYFDDPFILYDLFVEMESWLGTPYKHLTGVKGRGCDCIHFLARCLEAVGAGQGRVFMVPWYAKDWHLHEKSAPLLVNGVTKQVPCVEVGRNEVRNGDIVLSQFGHQVSHCGIYYNEYVYQALVESGVEKRKMAKICFKHVYRVIKI